jgi:hypothetical protein
MRRIREHQPHDGHATAGDSRPQRPAPTRQILGILLNLDLVVHVSWSDPWRGPKEAPDRVDSDVAAGQQSKRHYLGGLQEFASEQRDEQDSNIGQDKQPRSDLPYNVAGSVALSDRGTCRAGGWFALAAQMAIASWANVALSRRPGSSSTVAIRHDLAEIWLTRPLRVPPGGTDGSDRAGEAELGGGCGPQILP